MRRRSRSCAQELAQAHGVNVMVDGADMSRADAIEAMMAQRHR